MDYGRTGLREGEGNSMKYLKRGWNGKEGRGNKYFKKGGNLGQGSGYLKKRGVGIPLQTILQKVLCFKFYIFLGS